MSDSSLEEHPNVCPSTVVRDRVVGASWHNARVRSWIAEDVHRLRVDDELPVSLRRIHFTLECGALFARDEWILRTDTGKD